MSDKPTPQYVDPNKPLCQDDYEFLTKTGPYATQLTPKPNSIEDDMRLPEGKTCADCVRFPGCKSFIGITGLETSCDWAPSYFVQRRVRLTPESNIEHLQQAEDDITEAH